MIEPEYEGNEIRPLIRPDGDDRPLLLDTYRPTVIHFELKVDENVEWSERVGDTEARAHQGRQDVRATLVIAGKFEEQIEADKIEFRYLGLDLRAFITKRWIDRYQRQPWQDLGLPVRTLRLPRYTTTFELRFVVTAGRDVLGRPA